MATGSPNGQVEEPPRHPPLTAEERERGLHPKTLDDLRFRGRAFAPIVAGYAEHLRKTSKRKKS